MTFPIGRMKTPCSMKRLLAAWRSKVSFSSTAATLPRIRTSATAGRFCSEASVSVVVFFDGADLREAWLTLEQVERSVGGGAGERMSCHRWGRA